MNDKPTTSKRKTSTTADEPDMAMIDYKGIIARPHNLARITYPAAQQRLSKRPVEHVRSPYIQAWPENGRMALCLQPGFNRMDGETWRFYRDNSPQVKAKIRSGEIVELSGPPDSILDIVDRSYCHESLAWLRDQIANASIDSDDVLDAQDKAERQRIAIDAIDMRVATTSPLTIRMTPWSAPPVYTGAQRSNATSHGMG